MPSQPAASAPLPLRSLLLRLTMIPVAALAVILVAAGAYRTVSLVREIESQQRNYLGLINQVDALYLQETGLVVQTQALQLSEEDFLEHRQVMLISMRAAYPRFTGLYLLDDTGKVILEDTDGISLLGLDLSGEKFFHEGLQQRGVYFSDPFISLTSGKITITAAAPLVHAGQSRGMLVGELDLEYLQRAVAETALQMEALTYFVDRRGAVLIHPNPQWVQEQRNLSNLALIQQARVAGYAYQIYRQAETGVWVLGSAATMLYGWVVVIEQPLAAMLTPVYSLLLVSVVSFLVALAGFGWAQYYSASRITRPIVELARRADALAHGQSAGLPDVGLAEFTEAATLTESFARMVQAVQERTAQLEQANQELAHANDELAQLNIALEGSNMELADQINERQRAEAEVRHLNLELEDRVLERTAQLEAAVRELDAFSYSISHDLRAPLRAIDGYSRAVLEDYGSHLDETGHSYLGRVREATRKMNLQIEALLNLSRLSRASIYLQPVDLSEIAQQISADLREAAPERQVEFCIQEQLTAQADINLMIVVMDNLLRNAWKFSAPNPNACIEVGSLRGEDSTKIFFVKDNGVGFDNSLIHRLFGPFQRLHSEAEFEGTGIGLATVQRIVRRHGGQVWADSAPGEGATFFFTLPES